MMKNDGSITYTRMDTTIHSAILTVEAEKKDLSESLTVVVVVSALSRPLTKS